MISGLLLPSCVRLATYSLVRGSRLIRAKQIMYSARLASLLPPRLRRCLTTVPHHLAGGGLYGRDPAQVGEGGFAPQPMGVVPDHGQERRGAVGADARQSDQLRATCATSRARCASSSTISAERAS